MRPLLASRATWVLSAAFLVAFASIAAFTALQDHARSSHDAQVTLGDVERSFEALQSVPYDVIGDESAPAVARVKGRMRAEERKIERTLAALQRETSTPELLKVAAPYRANIVVLDQILSLLARGGQSEADALGPVAGRPLRAASRELTAAGGAYRRRAVHALNVAKFGSAGVVLGLVALFAVFYLRSRKTAAETGRLTEEHAKLEVLDAQLQVIQRLARAAEYRDDDTGEHTRRVGDLSARVGAALELPGDQLGLLREAAPLHDVGKVGIPDGILLKPGRLTKDEFEQMKAHATLGAGMLAGREFPLLAMAEEIALAHHERWDGSGYPEGLSGDTIPLMGRIVAVADVFDALTHRRPYKEAWTVGAAVAEITAQSGRQFDPDVVSAFMLALPEYLAPSAGAVAPVVAEPFVAEELPLAVPEALVASSD